MPLREERSFDVDGPVGIYWLRNSTGFRVVTPRRRAGTVEEVGVRESDGHVDVLAVRRRGLFRSHVTLVPAERVTVVSPWDQTLVLAPRRQKRAEPVLLPAPVPVAPEPVAPRAAPTPVAPLPPPDPETFVLSPPEPEPETFVLPEPEPVTE